MDVQNDILQSLLGHFTNATVRTLQIQCSFDCIAGEPQKIYPEIIVPSTDIAGVIALRSDLFHGQVALCLPQGIFLALMSNMLGEDYAEIDEDLIDGASELMNIIFGMAKKVLNHHGYNIDMALPSIFHEEDLPVEHSEPESIFILPFDSSLGLFYMKIGIEAQ